MGLLKKVKWIFASVTEMWIKVGLQLEYFDSSYLGHATANDLQSSFTSLLNDQILSKIVQVLMDGPNVI